jgi:hypothetical protein
MSRPAHTLKGGDVIAGVGEVFDSGPHADSRFVIVRILGRSGVESLALLADAEIEVSA